VNETDLLHKILVLASKAGLRLSRNNCGSLQNKQGQYVTYGVFNPGGSDLIGFTPVIITKDMVGKQVAVFTAIEAKVKNRRTTDQQQHFIEFVNDNGGIARIVMDDIELDALCALTKFLP